MNRIFLGFVGLGLFIGQNCLAISEGEAIGIATAYMKTVTNEEGAWGPVPRPELPGRSQLARIVYSEKASPESAFAAFFGVRFDSPYDDGCDLVVLVSARTGELLPEAVFPGFSPFPEFDKLSTSKRWRCWLGDEHPNG